jgi:hypothetical protein
MLEGMNQSKYHFATAKQLYGHYEYHQLLNHRAIVIFPYAMMSYGITELYALGIPILVPTIDLLIELGLGNDRTTTNDCGLRDRLIAPPRSPASSHPFSPEDMSKDAKRYWFQFADYYQWPHITRFSDFKELEEALESLDFRAVHERMADENVFRERRLKENWESVFRVIEPNRKFPRTFESGMKSWWRTLRNLG